MAVRVPAEVLQVSGQPDGPRRGADCRPGLPSEVMAASWAKQARSVAAGEGEVLIGVGTATRGWTGHAPESPCCHCFWAPNEGPRVSLSEAGF